MLVRHKVASKDTAETILKRYKVKDPRIVEGLPQNAKLMSRIKSLDKLAAGDIVWVPDPTATCYIVPFKGKKTPFTEQEWQTLQSESKKAMKAAVKLAQNRFDQIDMLYLAQKDVNKEFPVISWLSSNWVGDTGDEPVSQRKKAKASVKALEAAINSGDFKKIEYAVKDCERAVSDYGKGVKEWREQLIGSAENWETGLTIYRDGSYIFLGAMAMAAAAPASAGAAVLYGAGVGGASGFTKSALNELGKANAGYNVTAASATMTIAVDTLKNAGFGALGSGASAAIGKLAAPALARVFTNSKVVTAYATKVFARSPVAKKLFDRAQQRAVKILSAKLMKMMGTKEVPKAVMGSIWKIVYDDGAKIAAEATARYIIRMGVSGVMTTLRRWIDSPEMVSEIETYLKDMFKKPKKGQTEQGIADDLAKRIERSKSMNSAMEALVADNSKSLEFEICQALTSYVEAHPTIQKHPEIRALKK